MECFALPTPQEKKKKKVANPNIPIKSQIF